MTISIEEALYVVSRLQKGERIDIRRNVRFAHSGVSTIRDNADRFAESAKSDLSFCVASLPQSYQNESYQKV